ncbi:MAG: HAD hydrolase family protein [Candidatus Bathyarchaeota archaeon]|nr:HAD hydrolase family protein [Candidatus Bathyarchaeota archaeon]
MKRVFISDCEGPISKNDNAFELTAHFVPNGDKLFTVISKYDDVLAEILKRPNYKAGDTLKLILPFLKAYGVTDKKMRDFSARSLLLIANVKDMLSNVRSIAHAFIVSTSYQHYIEALCQTLDFPYENTYCTKLCLDKYAITENEVSKLKEIAREIAEMPIIEIPEKAKKLSDFSRKDQKLIIRLDEIFWNAIAKMAIGKIFSEVNPVGGGEKAEAVKEIAKKASVGLADVMYVGDSITDLEAFRLVRENGGLAVSFNGNEYAVKNAEVAVLSQDSLTTAVIAETFSKFGKEQTLNIIQDWSHETLKKASVNPALLDKLFGLHPEKLPKVKIITKENMESLAKESCGFRKKVRGEAIGRLG